MNIQHSSRTDIWYTPINILDKVKAVLQTIDLDPASDDVANKRVNALNIITEQQDSLSPLTEWKEGNLFLNPPGGKIGNKSRTSMFWQRLMLHRQQGKLTHGIFLAFSAEALQNTQGKGCSSIGEYIICIPKKRIRFDDENGNPGKAPSHSNVIVYIPGTVDERNIFYDQFKDVGVILNMNKTLL